MSTVLLVEDNVDDSLLTKRAFRKAGVPVQLRIVEDGDQAVAYLLGEGDFADRTAHPHPGLVLLDWKLPRRSGREVLEWIRTQSAVPTLPVVVISSSREEEDIAAAYAAGCDSYLQKPVLFDKLGALGRGLNLPFLQGGAASEGPV